MKAVKTVPCARCSTPIPAARAAIAVTHGMCAACNRPNLKCAQADNAPLYETDAWSRGIKL